MPSAVFSPTVTSEPNGLDSIGSVEDALFALSAIASQRRLSSSCMGCDLNISIHAALFIFTSRMLASMSITLAMLNTHNHFTIPRSRCEELRNRRLVGDYLPL